MKKSALEIVLASPDEYEGDDVTEDQMDAADVLQQALEDKDSEAIVEAFKAMLYLCKR
jgi:DNA-binding phage protein